MKLIVLFILLMLPFSGFTQSKVMKVKMKDGTAKVYPIADILCIRFDSKACLNDLYKWQGTLNAFARLKTYPNPSRDQVTLEYDLPESGAVSITIFDTSGKEVLNETIKNQHAGKQQYFWGGTVGVDRVPGGIYHCNVQFGNTRFYEKVIIVK